MTNRIVSLALGALAALCAPAFAAFPQSASADIAQLRYELIDLNPNDGILPSISFTDSEYFLSVNLGPTQWDRVFADTPGVLERSWAGTTLRTAVSDAGASASISMASAVAGANFYTNARLSQNFTLSPYTGVIWSVLTQLTGGAEDAYGYQQAAIEGRWVDADGDTFDEQQTFSSQLITGVWAMDQRSETLSGYLYSDARQRNGSVDFAVSQALYTPGPVPEPATWGMLAAGLGLLGMRLRGKQRA